MRSDSSKIRNPVESDWPVNTHVYFAGAPGCLWNQALAEKHPKPLSISAKLHEKLLVKEHELAGPAVKKVEKGGFADIEAARQRNAIAAKVEESITGDEHTGESVIRGDIRSRAAGNVDFNHDAFWDDKEAQKLSHTSVNFCLLRFLFAG